MIYVIAPIQNSLLLSLSSRFVRVYRAGLALLCIIIYLFSLHSFLWASALVCLNSVTRICEHKFMNCTSFSCSILITLCVLDKPNRVCRGFIRYGAFVALYIFLSDYCVHCPKFQIIY